MKAVFGTSAQESLFGAERGGSPVVVRSATELERSEEELVAQAGLSSAAPVEAWTVTGTNRELAYATHGLFRFFGKFPPPIARHLILKHTQPGDFIVDPTVGSGTTAVESLLLGRDCYAADISPLSTLLATVKTKRLALDSLLAAIERIRSAYRPLSVDDFPFEPVGLRNPDHWFLPATADSLRGLRSLIEDEANLSIREFLWVVFASTVRRVSRATTQQGRLFLDVRTALEDALDEFVKRATSGARRVALLPQSSTSTLVERHDLKVPFDDGLHGRARLVIVHPPYFNAYRYSSINSLELSWLAHAHAEVRKHEIREFFKVGNAEGVNSYLEDLLTGLSNAATLLADGGHLALMMGDTVLRGEYIATTRLLLEDLSFTGLGLKSIALRIPRFTEATWVASQRRKSANIGVKLCDFVLEFVKATG